ncbi:plastoglobulin-1, chloroplastic [Euphorbia lathyris]|uniref:plastoglobulin-1, chloroplastic n=1 Tax=Euphorbia lathyris TaxID=212925 RepID=UPI003313C667
MAILPSSSSSSLFFNNNLLQSSPTISPTLFFFFNKPHKTLNFTSKHLTPLKPTFPSFIPLSSLSESAPEPDSNTNPNPNPDPNAVSVTDEWGEKTSPEPYYATTTDVDPPRDEDEWEEEYASGGNGSVDQGTGVVVEKDDTLDNLKKALVDTVYGTNFGFGASPQVRGEVSELVSQLEALNPTPSPVDSTANLDGEWILLYTAFSELLPLLAVGTTPLLKVEKISQTIDSNNLSIDNSTKLSSPFATFSFSATASFEVRSPSRIQVQFKESTLRPPEIKSTVDLPENLNIFGQNVNISPVQQIINPLQDFVANISRTISGQPPLKVPIPGDSSRSSWLLITYLDEDLRISRGDGGLFVLVKEGSPLLD